MNRRRFLGSMSAGTLACAAGGSVSILVASARKGSAAGAGKNEAADPMVDAETARDWLRRWEEHILAEARRNRYCDTEMGEELGWLVSPFLNGFYYGYLATRDLKWLELLVDWTDSVLTRAQKEPDGFRGWPKGDGGGRESDDYTADSLLGEAMMWRPVVLAAAEILKDRALDTRWGPRAKFYLATAGDLFQKWHSRGAWRSIKVTVNGKVQDGGLWVVPAFGVDRKAPGQWSAGSERRQTDGFSNPDNKQNHIARWLVAMYDVTGEKMYRDHAEAWWRVMRSRMTTVTRDGGKSCFVWNYWEPGGPWDYEPDGSTRHWVGVHPNGRYYEIDVEGMVTAFEHKLVFSRPDIDRLMATNRDFMWNRKLDEPKFQRIDGGPVDGRWRDSPGMLWTALAPYDETLRKLLVATNNPASWGGLVVTPWALTTKQKELTTDGHG